MTTGRKTFPCFFHTTFYAFKRHATTFLIYLIVLSWCVKENITRNLLFFVSFIFYVQGRLKNCDAISFTLSFLVVQIQRQNTNVEILRNWISFEGQRKQKRKFLFCIVFWVGWSLLCLCRPFYILETYPDSNAESCLGKHGRATNLVTHLPKIPLISLKKERQISLYCLTCVSVTKVKWNVLSSFQAGERHVQRPQYQNPPGLEDDNDSHRHEDDL